MAVTAEALLQADLRMLRQRYQDLAARHTLLLGKLGDYGAILATVIRQHVSQDEGEGTRHTISIPDAVKTETMDAWGMRFGEGVEEGPPCVRVQVYRKEDEPDADVS